MKSIAFVSYALLAVVMGTATIVEKYMGTPFTHEHIYGSWWFTALWGVLAAGGIACMIGRCVRRPSVIVLHLSFIVILIGALLTHLTARQGTVHLRIGENARVEGYTLALTSFDIDYRPGTPTPADYRSTFTLTDGNRTVNAVVSMNNIFSYGSMRLYQLSYDTDMRGGTLAMNADPYGIPVTYTGYALLFIALVYMLADPKGGFRRVLRGGKTGGQALYALMLLVAAAAPGHAAETAAPPAMPEETADEFGRLYMLLNGRVCPVQTYAYDFVTKVYGSRGYKGLSPEQVATGWMFWSGEWADEPFIKVKGGALKDALSLPDYCPLNKFFSNDTGGYILGMYVQEYYEGNRDALHRQAADIDDKIQLILALRRGTALTVFPHTFTRDYSRTHTDAAVSAGTTLWYAPTDPLHFSLSSDERTFIRKLFSLMYEDVRCGDYAAVAAIIDKLVTYQQTRAATLPTPAQAWAERTINAVPMTTILFMANMLIGIAAMAYVLRLLTGARRRRAVDRALTALIALSFAALTALIALRWIAEGNIPLSNGYETTLAVAWIVQFIALVLCRRAKIVVVFGFLVAAFFLLVSHLNQMDPAIGTLMPVLDSKLLAVHVSIVMASYALLSMTFVCAVLALVMPAHAEALRDLALLLLYPAVATLAMGIFIGAVWANVSWGTYWSWDAKETWALITLMVYAVPLHDGLLPAMRKRMVFHVYVAAAFLTVLMTYFGVNYFLGGMHSYA